MKLLVTINVVFIFLSSCSHSQESKNKVSKDSFYTRSGGWDYIRVPLIKPYEAMKLKGSNEWLISLHTNTLDLSISGIKKVNVVDSAIMVYSQGDTYLRGTPVQEAWFIILPARKIEVGFDSKDEYLNYLSDNKISNLRLLNIDSVFSSFNKKGSINWGRVID